MSDADRPVTAEMLHAYVDGQLPDGDIARVEQWLADHPDDQARLLEWQAQNNSIKSMFAPYQRALANDATLLKTPEAAPTRRWSTSVALAAASICLFAAGALTGYLAAPSRELPVHEASVRDEASSAFLIYASEVRHPVEVRADDKDHLVAWLGKKLGHKLSAPDLSGLGFSLVGGRLVPANGKAGALLMYEEASGKRLTVLIGQSQENAVTSFRFAANGPVETFYWIDDKLSYAVTGEIPRDLLRRVADTCYQQFDT
ncbi:anti-sigma factor [Rhizobium sp. KVB221]|uniref:Anti-sigma factor n=1 Tax=Rhizobium setariae TaxID=2801340 RepID=A0A936YPG8_9HYPH|nr:anti-sigma factor [Rhizobium setariae]MBL0374399.1 anti-sigma factor [Rhizobium setariae]